MQALLALTARLDIVAAIGLSLAVNVLLFAMMIGLGGLIARIWRARPVVSPPPALSRFEIVLATVTVVVNAGVAGFGGLWIVVLCTTSFSLGGMMLYLTVNSVFGTFGHVGVEPLPERWSRLPLIGSLGTSTFHARHHQRPDRNFGFYTSIWDRLFRSLDPTYASTFGRPPDVEASTKARSSSPGQPEPLPRADLGQRR